MSKKHILIVDDELMLLYSLKRMLEDEYDVTIAGGGQKAIDLINQGDQYFDIILSDVSMPDINGVNLYLYLAKHHPGLEKRIMFMTGGPTSVYLDDFFTTIPNPRLTKPFEAPLLMAHIKKFSTAKKPNK